MMMMCKADISLLTYEWIPHYHKVYLHYRFPLHCFSNDLQPFPVWDVTHECTNWDKINTWTTERALDMNNIPVHPELMGGWVDPETMSADARYFLDQVKVYEDQKEKDKEDALRAKVLGEVDANNCSCRL